MGGTGAAPGSDPMWDRLLVIAVLATAAVLGAVLATGHLATLVVNQGIPRYPLNEIPSILWGIATGLDDPGRAWDPVNEGVPVPGPIAWWATFAALVAGIATVGFALRPKPEQAPEMEWGKGRSLRKLKVSDPDCNRLIIGRSGHSLIATESRHSVLVFGPTQSGKTTGFAVPAILEWPGPVVATSVKDDLIADTIGWRTTQGRTHVFDPAGVSRFDGAHWTPLVGCETWDGAMRIAWDLARAGKAAVGGSDMALGEFWFNSAAKGLGPFLLAAATTGHTISDVARWIDAEDHDGVVELLWDHPDALLALEATFKREDRARSSIFQVMQQIVGVYLDPAVAGTATRSDFSPTDLFDGTNPTLYLTAPARDQDRFRPLFSTLLAQIIDTAFDHAARNGGTPLDPPLLLVLDEAANIAPVDNLDQIASTAAALGIQLVTVFQDMAQVRNRYGDRSQTVVNNHRGTLFLPGIKCTDTLEYLSRLVGEHDYDRPSHSVDHLGHHSHSASLHRQRLLPVDVARTLDDGRAVLLYGNLPPIDLRLRPWFKDRRLRHRAEISAFTGPSGSTTGGLPPNSSREATDSYQAHPARYSAAHPRVTHQSRTESPRVS